MRVLIVGAGAIGARLRTAYTHLKAYEQTRG